MKQRSIWAIIGVMMAAMIGIILLQMYWIRWSIQLNERQFDRSVYTALNRITEKVQYAEELKDNIDAFSVSPTGGGQYWKQEFFQKVNGQGDLMLNMSATFGTVNMHKDSLQHEAFKLMNNGEEECNCANCQRERFQQYERQVKYWQLQQINKLINPIALTERIDLQQLEDFLNQELANVGLNDLDHQYGVFSNREQDFVILNGHYVIPDNSPQIVKAGLKTLYNSGYRVDLFPADMRSPGLLMIHFPSKVSLLWGSVWKTLMLSIVFTGLILFCFAYTIQVIFRQKKLSEMKGDFINNMTHEFKTPIATISLAADSITSPMISGSPDKVKRFAGIIKQENKRMNAQVEKVLQMALMDKREFNLKLTQVDMHDVIRQAVENITLQVEKKEGVVLTDLQADTTMVEGDLTHLSNIINNLLDNANKYTPDTPEIKVSTKNISGGIEVTIKDNGIGMTKEARKHIFDKFYRVHTGDIHDVKGFGLGLSYVKAMMTAHKGTIDVKSELGKGSSFILFFPYRVQSS